MAQGELRHLHLTSWQEEILHQLKNLPYVLRSLLFLPTLIEDQKGVEQLVNFKGQQYLYVRKKNVVFWMCLENKDCLTQQLNEIGLYLRRYTLEFDEGEKSLISSSLTETDLQKKALNTPPFPLQSNNFLPLQELLEKQRKSQSYMLLFSGLVSLMAGGMIAGIFFLFLSIQTFVEYNPYTLNTPSKILKDGDYKKLLQFKNFLLFHTRSPRFSLLGVEELFQKFSGKIVATDMIWQEGKWTITFVLNPHYPLKPFHIANWCAQNLEKSNLTRSENTPLHYILQFEQPQK
jgi:hypothetical protein